MAKKETTTAAPKGHPQPGYDAQRHGDAHGQMDLQVTVNGEPQRWRISVKDMLLEVLRREGYRGAKKGCETGDCGVCAVLVDGQPMASCMMLAAQVQDRSITTIEGLGHPDAPHPIQAAFATTGATQCGFCNPGMILSAKALLDKNPHPSEDEIRVALDGVLCRCTGYIKQIEAVQLAAGKKSRRTK